MTQNYAVYLCHQFSSFQSISCVRLHVTPCSTPASLSITNSSTVLKLMPIESVMPSNHLILCRPLLLLPSIFPSIRVFSKGTDLHHQVAKVLKFRLQHQFFRLISFRVEWFDLLAVQGTLRSLFQHQSSKVSILQCSVFFMVQISHPYMTTT